MFSGSSVWRSAGGVFFLSMGLQFFSIPGATNIMISRPTRWQRGRLPLRAKSGASVAVRRNQYGLAVERLMNNESGPDESPNCSVCFRGDLVIDGYG